jgi:hypothetical protein
MSLEAVWPRLFAVVTFLASGSLPLAHAAEQTLRIQDDAVIIAIYTLPDIHLATVHNEVLPDHPIADDPERLLGGVGSDLWHGPGDAADEFWMVTDRGPNSEVEVNGEEGRAFPVPGFTPLILHVRAEDAGLVVIEVIPIVNQAGDPATGLPNLNKVDEAAFDVADQRLDLNSDGLDVEGLVRTADGGFWLADEYRPSLVKVDATGKVLARYIPEGVELPGAGYPIEDTLPAIYAMRKINRGFEGLALSGDGHTLYAVLQSPLLNPDKDTGEKSRIGRILALDVASGQPVAEYVYQFEDAHGFDCGPADCKKKDMKISGLVWLDETTLLALERTDQDARLYTVDLSAAKDILGTDWDDRGTPMSLEELEDPAAAGVDPLAKTLLADLDELPDMPDKIEGVAVINDETVAVANDNDFDIEGTGAQSQLLVIHTPLLPRWAMDFTVTLEMTATGFGYFPGLAEPVTITSRYACGGCREGDAACD